MTLFTKFEGFVGESDSKVLSVENGITTAELSNGEVIKCHIVRNYATGLYDATLLGGELANCHGHGETPEDAVDSLRLRIIQLRNKNAVTENNGGKKVVGTDLIAYEVTGTQSGFSVSISIYLKNSELENAKPVIKEYFENFPNFRGSRRPIEITYKYLGALHAIE